MSLELGGKAPNIVMDDADLDCALRCSADACFLSSGQCCFAGSRVFVHEAIYDQFIEKAAAMAKERKIGTPYEKDVRHGPIISQIQFEKVHKYIEMGKKEKARLVCGGTQLDREGFFVENTVFADVTDSMYIAQNQVLGPVMCIMKFSCLDEVIARVNKTKCGLGCGVATSKIETALKIAEKINTGTVMVNSWSSLEPTTPFGGFKDCGIGKEMGQEALDNYLEIKTVIIRASQATECD